MTSRLDRLLLLLDTGSSSSVRNTAAKQLAQLAVKGVASRAIVEEDVKAARQDTLRDHGSWTELMSVVARIIPYLHSKSFESRTAASVALSQIFSLSPVWQPLDGEYSKTPPDISTDVPPEYPNFSLRELLVQGKLLLASSGKEFIKPAGILASAAEVKKARKEAMSRLGLDFLDEVADDMDLDKELAQDMVIDPELSLPPPPPGDVANTLSEMDLGTPEHPSSKDSSVPARDDTPAALSPTSSVAASMPEPDLTGLSARERNRLKRKRKPGNAAFVAAPPPQSVGAKYATAASGPSNKARLVAAEDKATPKSRITSPAPVDTAKATDRVVVDPSKGGAVSPKATKQSKALEVKDGGWIWDGVIKVLEVDLLSAAWEVRHGAALALRELLKVQGRYGGMKDSLSLQENELSHEKWCNDLSAKFLCVFLLDRFGDFVSDQVVAPVRETVSQTLASLLIHMPRRSMLHVHSILLQMIRQDSVLTLQNGQSPDPEHNHVWEVRHAGLLGIKYEVAVRSDLFEWAPKQEGGSDSPDILKDVVDAAILGLGDKDDDVRSVAASCLLPVANLLVEQIPHMLEPVLVVLWRCLSDMKDDLSSSVGAVMDLLGTLVTYEKVIRILANDVALPLSTLATTLFPFFRHTISNVRLAVIKTLDSFMTVPTLPREWVSTPFFCLLFQNIICEERGDIREITLIAWERALTILSANLEYLESTIDQALILDWYAIMMTPIGLPVDTSKFYRPSLAIENAKAPERHNVDKSMLAQDLSLVSMETILRARVTAATALADLLLRWRLEMIMEVFKPIIIHYMDSTSMLQKFLAGVIAEEWAHRYSKSHPPPPMLLERSDLAKELSDKSLMWLQDKPPLGYHELTPSLVRIHAETSALLQSFSTQCKLPLSSIPDIGVEVDVSGLNPRAFTIDSAQVAIGTHYNRLRDSLGRTKKKELAVIAERREKIDVSIKRYLEIKAQNDNRVSASFAGAFVAFESVPDKVSPVVKGIMNGIKNEENVDLQTRSAVAVARFVKFCSMNNITQPPDKIVKNLCTFLCQDAEQTPMFSFTKKRLEGILSFTTGANPSTSKEIDQHSQDPTKLEEVRKARLSRRGAQLAFQEFSDMFGSRLFDILPNIWPCTVGGLMSAFQCDSPEKSDQLIEKQFGQDVIDSLSVLEAVVPTFHPDLHSKFTLIFPMLEFAMRSQFAIIRQCTSKCFATICDVMPDEALRYIVEQILPLVSDPLNLFNRQGGMELIYQVVQRLDIKVLPYVIFLIVPILGRMSDVNDEIRATSTNTFASLVKMVPLEAGLPDPPGFSKDLLKRRDEERQFLAQLLDGSKVEQYEIPVKINAELRKYQQDGVNWLAFLAKYQLHGILCDDMGLGKTLQSICILASKHHERAERRHQASSPDSIHLPSLIICPPTLTGHWYYEILKYAENLRPVLYTGNSRERTRLLSKLHQFDVIITSYEVVRNDISSLEEFKWLYCILDEGHVIKNSKTKLTKAVKLIQAQHRLILSGTPIQNNVLELWSLFDFLMPGFLGTEATFNERFGKPILSNRDGKAKTGEAAALALEALHKQVLPFLLRRLKEDVLHDLPPKIIQDYYCELSELQKQLYDNFAKSKVGAAAEQTFQSGDVDKADPQHQHVFQSLQYLRKLCNHPALVLKDEESTKSVLAKANLPLNSLKDIQNAPKLLALKQLLLDCGIGSPPGFATDSHKSELIDTPQDSSGAFSQHRVLIFCQMKQMLDIIETDLFKPHMPSVTYMRLDGSTDANKRHAIVQTFNADPSIDCLLLTTHVGGLGLTLTGADTVIFVEHDWNPMKDLQAMDRAHRIGQKKVVNVYRLITKGTLEEKIMGLQRFKLNIAHSVVTQQNSGLSSMETDQVLDLFRRTTEEEDAALAARKAKESSKPVTQKNLLAALDNLPDEEYEGLDLSTFMTSLGRP